MPKSKIYLPDINVWLALTAERHRHHREARRWFEGLDGTALFCRVTQMGLVRLLCNPKVLFEDVLTATAAWEVYRVLREDFRVEFSAEPGAIEERWEVLTRDRSLGSATWTDLYLEAFAELRRARIVSFDQAFKSVSTAVVLGIMDERPHSP